MFTFEIQWPRPFDQAWKRSSKRVKTVREAATALADYLSISAENGEYLAGRIVKVG